MDRPASCVPANASTRARIAEWWQAFFDTLPDGSRILDVATGNGIVLAYASASAARRGMSFELTGLDLADIAPTRYLSTLPPGLAQATFLGKTAAESLPFPDASFDIVVSQYGLEYADLQQALAEAGRVLRPEGRLLWLAHSADSDVVRQNRDQHRQVDLLLARGGPVEAMERLVDRARRGRGIQPAVSALAAALREAQDFCRADPPAGIVQEVCQGLAEVGGRWQAYRVADLDAMMRDTRRKLVDHRARIEDLRLAILTPEREQVVRRLLEKGTWHDVALETVRAGLGDGPIGLAIEATRSAGA